MKGFYFFVKLLIVGVFLFTTISAQQNGRTLKNKKWKDEPLEITDLMVKERKVKFKEKLIDNNDWFRNLKIGVKNISGKMIVFIDIALTFPANEAVTQDAPANDHLIYGQYPVMPGEIAILHPDEPPLRPGEKTILVLKDYEGTREFLNQASKSQVIEEIEVGISEVVFEDGTKWSRGDMYKRNPNAPDEWLPVRKPNSLFVLGNQSNLLLMESQLRLAFFFTEIFYGRYPMSGSGLLKRFLVS